MSGTPIITVLLKVCASARAAVAVVNGAQASVAPNSSAADAKYSPTGRKSSSCRCTCPMVRKSSAGVSSRKTMLDRSGTAVARTQPTRAMR